MESENFPSHASLGKNYLKIAQEPAYSLCFLDKTGAVHLISGRESLFFLALETEAGLVKKFGKKPDDCIITAN